MSHEDRCEAGILAIADALVWALANGWHSSAQDLQQAAQIWLDLESLPMPPERRGERFTARLIDVLEGTGADARHRAVLARLMLRKSGMDS